MRPFESGGVVAAIFEPLQVPPRAAPDVQDVGTGGEQGGQGGEEGGGVDVDRGFEVLPGVLLVDVAINFLKVGSSECPEMRIWSAPSLPVVHGDG